MNYAKPPIHYQRSRRLSSTRFRMRIWLPAVILLLFVLSSLSQPASAASTHQDEPPRAPAICGTIYSDLEGDGQISDESPTLGLFQIMAVPDGSEEPVGLATSTLDGRYCIPLPLSEEAVQYTVSQLPEEGWTTTLPRGDEPAYQVTVTPDEVVGGANFAIFPGTRDICGDKYNDINGNGHFDPGEPPLEGWIFELSNNAGGPGDSATSNDEGRFCFELGPGEYTITEVPQNGWTQTQPVDNEYTFVVGQTPYPNKIVFGNTQERAKICGIKFNDINGNGIQDAGELGLPGWTIQAEVNGTIHEAVTGRGGRYCINRPPTPPSAEGNYTVSEVMQDGWEQTYPDAPGTHIFPLPPGGGKDGVNFGNHQTEDRVNACVGKQPSLTEAINYTLATDKVAVATCFASNIGSDTYVMGVMDISDHTNAQTYPDEYTPPMYHHPDWTREKMGNIFGLALDNDGNMYTTATSAYLNDYFGSGGSGVVYKIDAVTGIVSTFATLPNDPLIRPGLGNITYDPIYKHFYVSNMEDGLIYQLGSTGTVLSTYDHGNAGRISANLTPILDDNTAGFTQVGRRIWAVEAHNGRLFYSVWWEHGNNGFPDVSDVSESNEIWSIPLDGFPAIISTLEITMPSFSNDFSNPVADISFSPTGTLLAAERTMSTDTLPGAHDSRAIEFVGSSPWVVSAILEIGQLSGGVNSAGGVDYDYHDDWVWTTGDALRFATSLFIYGLQGLPPGGTLADSTITDLDGNVLYGDKTQIGDVEVSCPVGCVEPPSDMIGWWTLDEISGTVSAADLAGIANDGTHAGGPVPVAGMVEGALDFDGTDDYVMVPDHPELDMGTGNFAIDAWIKTADSKGTFVSKRENAFLGIGYRLMVFNGKPLVQLVDDVVGFKNYFDASTSALTINDDQWHFVAANIDRVNGMGEIYVDGALIHSFTIANTGSLDNGGGLTIGTDLGSGEYFDGMIDEVELFTRTLTVGEITSIYNAGSFGKCRDNTAPEREPDLELSKSHLDEFHFGQTGTYSLTVTNVGDGPTTGNIEVIDQLPQGVTYVSANSPWVCQPSAGPIPTVSCFAQGPLNPGDSLTLTLEVMVGDELSNDGEIKNCATVETEGDGNPENDRDCDETTVTEPPLPPDLTIEKVHVGDFIIGQIGSYSVTVTNIGDGPTTGDIIVTDQLPEGTTFVGVTPSPPWDCVAGPATQVPQFLTCTYSGVLEPGDSVGFTLTVDIGDELPGDPPELRNCAMVNTEGESFVDNNEDCDDVIAMNGNQCVSPPSGMVAWWPLDEEEGAGTTATDLTTVNHGVHINGPVPTTAGKVAGALLFDGVDDYVEVPDDPTIDFTASFANEPLGDFSIDAWINTNGSEATTFMIVDKRERSATGILGYSFFLRKGRLAVSLADGTETVYDSGFIVTENEWHLVAVTVDRDVADGIRFYVDGSEVGTRGDPLPHSGELLNNSPLRIGHSTIELGFDPPFYAPFNGIIDEVEIFNEVVTPDDISSIFEADSAGKCKDDSIVNWDTPICRGGTSAVVPVSVCNNDIVDHTYAMPEIGGIVGLPADAHITCNVDFPNPTSYTVLTDLPLEVSAGQCEVMLVEVDAPPTLNASDAVGCFTTNVQNLETDNVFNHDGSLWRQNSWCAASGAGGDLPVGVATVPVSETLPLSFSISNTTGSAAELPWTLTIVPSDMEGENEVAGLNGMEPGQPVSGVMPIPQDGNGNLDFTVEFDTYEPFRTYSVLLQSTENPTTPSILSSMTVQSKPSPKIVPPTGNNDNIVYLPAIAR